MRVRLSLDPNCCQSRRPPPQMNELSRAPPRGTAHTHSDRSRAQQHALAPPSVTTYSAPVPPLANRRLLLHSGLTCELLLTNPNIDLILFFRNRIIMDIFPRKKQCIINHQQGLCRHVIQVKENGRERGGVRAGGYCKQEGVLCAAVVVWCGVVRPEAHTYTYTHTVGQWDVSSPPPHN